MPQSQNTIPQQQPQHPVPTTLSQQSNVTSLPSSTISSVPQLQQQLESDLPQQQVKEPSTTNPEMVISQSQTSQQQQPLSTILPQQQLASNAIAVTPPTTSATTGMAVPMNYPSENPNSKYKL